MTPSRENPIYAHDTLEFVTVAFEYCALMEKSEEQTEEEFVGTLLKLLPLLYMKVQLLTHLKAILHWKKLPATSLTGRRSR